MKKFGTFLFALAISGLALVGCNNDEDGLSVEEQAKADSTRLANDGNSRLETYFGTANNSAGTSGVSATSPVPTANTAGTVDLSGDSFFTTANYKGAVAPTGTPWYAENTWSYYAHILQGIPDKARTQGATTVTVTDGNLDGAAGDDATTINWTADNTYILDGFVFVPSGTTLNIAAGTVIKGKAGQGADASALIVRPGATINATGTSTQPIIFTYEGDMLDGTNSTGAATVSGEWGGLIILGNASLNSTPGTTPIEGLPSELNAIYGGSTDTDNSGTLRYVSIRHGGTDIGGGNEINGLSLGGVGSGTTLEYVEVIANKDDGIEWFGGTVNGKYLIVALVGDDSLDYDEGYRGKNQFVIVHQAAGGDRGGEHDGGTDPENAEPFATPTFANCTFIGNGNSRVLTFRDNAGGFYYNSIFFNFGRGIDIERFSDDSQSSFKHWEEGNLKIERCLFDNVAGDPIKVNVLIK